MTKLVILPWVMWEVTAYMVASWALLSHRYALAAGAWVVAFVLAIARLYVLDWLRQTGRAK